MREEFECDENGVQILDKDGKPIPVLDEHGIQKIGWNVFHFPETKPDGTKNLPKSFEDMHFVEDPLEDRYPHMQNVDGSARKKRTMNDHFR